jgi:hypothetical protein
MDGSLNLFLPFKFFLLLAAFYCTILSLFNNTPFLSKSNKLIITVFRDTMTRSLAENIILSEESLASIRKEE